MFYPSPRIEGQLKGILQEPNFFLKKWYQMMIVVMATRLIHEKQHKPYKLNWIF